MGSGDQPRLPSNNLGAGAAIVRRQIIWDCWRRDRVEDLAHLLIDVMRPGRGLASVWMVCRLILSRSSDGLGFAEVDVGRGEIGDALIVTAVIVVGDELTDLGFQITR